MINFKHPINIIVKNRYRNNIMRIIMTNKNRFINCMFNNNKGILNGNGKCYPKNK